MLYEDKGIRPIASLLIAPILVAAIGCGPSQETQQRMAELEQAAAQKDSLLIEVADLGRFMSDINAELSDVSLEESGLEVMLESPMQASRDSMLVKIQYLNDRVDRSAQRLAQSQRRIRAIGLESDTLEALLAETIRSYERTLENQRATIISLNDRVTALEADNVRLAATLDTVSTQLDTLKAESGTVYYAIGTKDELLERGLVEKEGGSRVLFIFGKRGETLVPARELDPTEFTAIDKHQMTAIPLPDSTAEYEIASRHPTDQVWLTDDGKISGSALEIASPDEFWQASKFLIVVQKD